MARDIAVALSKKFDATAIASRYSRLVYDLNRYSWDPFAMTNTSDSVQINGNQNLTLPERERRYQEIARPYYDQINTWIARKRTAGKSPALVSVHTMADRLSDGKIRNEGYAVLWDGQDKLSRSFMTALRENTDFLVGDNTPYALELGIDYTVPECALRHGIAAIMFEVRQDLTQDPDNFPRRIEELAIALEGTVRGN